MIKVGTSALHQLFQNSYLFEKVIFSEKKIFHTTYFSWIATFLKRPFFQKTLPSTVVTFSEELLSHKILFQKSCYFIATLLLYSYTYYQLVIKWAQWVTYTWTVGFLLCVSITAESRIIDKTYLTNWLQKLATQIGYTNWLHKLATQRTLELLLFDKAIFSEPLHFKDHYFFKTVIYFPKTYLFRRCCLLEQLVFTC